MDSRNKSNLELQNKFYDYLDNKNACKEDLVELKSEIKKNHNKQWSDKIYNILSVQSNCVNDCKYCYMKRLKNKFFDVDLEDLSMNIDPKKIDKNWSKSKKINIIMFPSSHDIFMDYIDDYISTCKKILDAGNQLLIVTKPRLDCIKKIMTDLKDYKNDILFRLTITSNDQNILNYWESNAPSYTERIKCLKILYENKFQTSVSLEPYLSNPDQVITDVTPFVTDFIWIGAMSGINTVEKLDETEKQRLLDLYSKQNVMSMINKYRHNTNILFKTSIMTIALK